MTIANATEDAILSLVFRSVSWTGYATNDATQTNIGIALHTGDPGEAGTAATNEVTTGAYAGYQRVNVPRGTGTPGWSAPADGVISPMANIDFPAGTGGSGASVTFFSTSSSNGAPPTGTAAILWSGGVSPAITVGSGVTPRLTTGTTISLA